MVVAVRPRIAAVENRAEFVGFHVPGRDRADVDLDQLADLVLQRHAPEQLVDPRLHLGITLELHREGRPGGGVRHRGGGRCRRSDLRLRLCRVRRDQCER